MIFTHQLCAALLSLRSGDDGTSVKCIVGPGSWDASMSNVMSNLLEITFIHSNIHVQLCINTVFSTGLPNVRQVISPGGGDSPMQDDLFPIQSITYHRAGSPTNPRAVSLDLQDWSLKIFWLKNKNMSSAVQFYCTLVKLYYCNFIWSGMFVIHQAMIPEIRLCHQFDPWK